MTDDFHSRQLPNKLKQMGQTEHQSKVWGYRHQIHLVLLVVFCFESSDKDENDTL